MSPILVDGVVGARPNMMKMAPLARALAADGTFSLRLIHTGQHFDDRMSAVFLRELGMAEPHFNLGVGPGSQALQTARIMEAYESLLLAHERPRGVVVVGDVNSTMACALAAAKLDLPVAHVEAGLRSGDRTMPEEINRIVTDTLSDLLFVSDPAGVSHLATEGHDPRTVQLVGNIMMDTLFKELPQAEASRVLEELGIKPGGYIYLTLHRPSNVDEPAVLKRLMETFIELSREMPVIFAIHPRTRRSLEDSEVRLDGLSGLRLVEPMGYRDNLKLIQCARAVVTDSGGIQEEAAVLGIPCLTVRDCTERPITVELGSSELIGNDPERIKGAWGRVARGQWKRAAAIPLWDGKTAGRIVLGLREAWA
jgi:UDP-N-acetylglucosamine 2-epimerase (non-hydrolysing)